MPKARRRGATFVALAVLLALMATVVVPALADQGTAGIPLPPATPFRPGRGRRISGIDERLRGRLTGSGRESVHGRLLGRGRLAGQRSPRSEWPASGLPRQPHRGRLARRGRNGAVRKRHRVGPGKGPARPLRGEVGPQRPPRPAGRSRLERTAARLLGAAPAHQRRRRPGSGRPLARSAGLGLRARQPARRRRRSPRT